MRLLTEEDLKNIGHCVGITVNENTYLGTFIGPTISIWCKEIFIPGMLTINSYTDQEKEDYLLRTYRFYILDKEESPKRGTTYICFNNSEEVQKAYFEELNRDKDE